MFNFNELKKFKIGELFDNLGNSTPKGNKSMYEDSEYNNVMTGAILCIASSIGSAIVGLLVLIGLASLFMELPVGDLDLSVNIDIIMIGVLLYTVISRRKMHNSWFEYIIMILATVGIVGDIFGLFGAVLLVLGSPVYAALLAVLLIIDIVGRIFIILGYQSFCLRNRKEYDSVHKVMPTGSINAENAYNSQNAVYQQQAPVQTPVQVAPKVCPYCGNQLGQDAKFCKSCGASVQ